MSLHFLKPDVTTSQNLSLAALSYTTSTNRKFKLEEITIHFSATVTETITITRDKAVGADYDDVLVKRSLVAEQDFVFRPQGECNFQAGDEVKVECTKATATATAYVVIKRKELP